MNQTFWGLKTRREIKRQVLLSEGFLPFLLFPRATLPPPIWGGK